MNSHWVPGNRITLLENGEVYFPRVFEAIAAAEHEVLLETFILFDDKVGRELQQALLLAAGRGAVVHVLVDGWGSPDLPPSFTQPLLDAGVRLRSFEPARRLLGARVNMLRRMHHKLVVVDGRRAFVGGINYSLDHLAEFGPLAKQDYAVEVEGPLVGQIQAFCRANLDAPQPARHDWLQRWRAIRHRRSGLEALGEGAVAAFVTRDNRGHRTDIERHYRVAVRSAHERVLIANAYFLPGFRFAHALYSAARRGVKISVLLQGKTDHPLLRYATQALYVTALAAGIRIFEYEKSFMHAKVAVVDDDPAVVASGPTVPDTTTREDALAIIRRYNIEVPAAVMAWLAKPESETPKADDLVLNKDNATVLIDSLSLEFMGGAEIDYVDDLIGQSFEIRNPNAVASCGCGTSFAV